VCSGCDQGDGQVTDGRDYQWDKEAGAPDASAFMNVAIPDGATQTKGAVPPTCVTSRTPCGRS
jgi:hypothetical protein